MGRGGSGLGGGVEQPMSAAALMNARAMVARAADLGLALAEFEIFTGASVPRLPEGAASGALAA